MPQESEKQALIHPTLHHFGVTTTHLKEMLDWYAKVLGMTTNFQSSHGLAFLSNDRAHHRLALLSLPGIKDNPDPILTPNFSMWRLSMQPSMICSAPLSA